MQNCAEAAMDIETEYGVNFQVALPARWVRPGITWPEDWNKTRE
jgi:hypothetical protein